jgi:hypothetical protein
VGRCVSGCPRPVAGPRAACRCLAWQIGLFLVGSPWIPGCGPQFAAPPARQVPAAAASKALAAYDANGDASLDDRELGASPSLLAARVRLDANKDGKVSAEEIAARLEAYRGMSDFIATVIRVTRSGKPVAGARVTLTADPFFGADDPVYSGVTDEHGSVLVALPGGGMQGLVPPGFYTVEVTGAEPAKRGYEIADDVPGTNRLEIAL